ncbi:DUF2066 domain-containing protein [Vreelandella utahensis]|uniref:DUF2066 domain-containing protein n=1 Tax=Vreelandella halophila TaxID=86177 RepID=UPI0015C2EC9B|nr:DUF2066 domain-containing protein [Halomonas utahensis]
MEQRIDRFRAGLLTGGLLLLLVLAGPAQAVVVDRLYQAVVPVDDTGPGARDEAFRQALRQVLLRLTGDPADVRELVPADDGGSTPERALDGDAARFIDAFSYRRNEEKLELHATLSAPAVGQMLAERGVAVWGASRPRILVWFAVDDRGDRELIHRENTLPPFLEEPMQPLDREAIAAERGPWKEPLWAESQRRGLPLALPFHDDRDRSEVSLSEIWGLFQRPIQQASRRYPHDLMATVRVNRAGGGWRARWQLWRGDDRVADGVVREDERAMVVRQLVDAWADRLADRYAVAPPKGQDLRSSHMVVTNVGSLESYAGVRRSLAGLEPIRSVQVETVQQHHLTLELAFNGDLRVLRDYIGLDERLVLMGGPPDGAIPADPEDGALRLYYRWDGERGSGMLPGRGEAQEIVPLDSGEDAGASGATLQ